MPQNLSTLLSVGLELTELKRPEIWVRTAQSWTRVTRNNFLRLIVIRTGILCEEYERKLIAVRESFFVGQVVYKIHQDDYCGQYYPFKVKLSD